MIAAWTKWRISTAVEKGRPLSPALARRVRRDPESRRFYEASLAMTERLRRDAEEIVEAEQARLGEIGPLEPLPAGTTASSRRAWSARLVLAMGTAAAVIGLALGAAAWWWPSRSPSPSPRAQAPAAVQEADVVELVGVIRQLKDNVDRAAERRAPQWEQVMAHSREALRAPIVREAENMAADTREILRALSSMIPLGHEKEPPQKGEGAPPPGSSGSNAPPPLGDASLAGVRVAAEIPI